jgi:hypothetical protein
MLILNPRLVVLGATKFHDVLAVSVEREAKRLVTQWSDFGPHVVFADVPEQIVRVRVVQEVMDGAPDGPRPGDTGVLSFVMSPTGLDSLRKRWSAMAVVTACTHENVTNGRGIGARRTVECVLVSINGASDPVSVVPVAGMGGEP